MDRIIALIRKAELDELPIAFNLLKEAAEWLHKKDIDYWQNWLDPKPGHRQWIEEGFQKHEFYFVVNSGNEIIAMFRLQKSDKRFWGAMDDRSGYLHSFTVRRILSGDGLGYKILSRIEELLKDESTHILRLDCGECLYNYYEQYGFRKVRVIELYGEKLMLYEKKIEL